MYRIVIRIVTCLKYRDTYLDKNSVSLHSYRLILKIQNLGVGPILISLCFEKNSNLHTKSVGILHTENLIRNIEKKNQKN